MASYDPMVTRAVGKPNCVPKQPWSIPYGRWAKPLLPYTGDDSLKFNPFTGCPLYWHDFMFVTDLKSAAVYSLNAKSAFWDAKKSFDISHPTKDGWRLRHVCLEGPDADVYIKGKLKDKNTIDLPPYWTNLIDPETVNVVLTPIGIFQELFVEKIEWGSRVIIKNASGGPINCYYQIMAERVDVPKNIAEYEGLTPNDYPGDNEEYSINAG